MDKYEYTGNSYIIKGGRRLSPLELVSLPENQIKDALKRGVIRELKKEEDAENSKTKKAGRTNGRSSTKKRSQRDGQGD